VTLSLSFRYPVTTGMSIHHKSSLWAHFLTTGQHYKENKSHLAAVCKYCMTNHMQNLKEEDAMAVLNGNLKSVRTDSELTEHGKFAYFFVDRTVALTIMS
jgi:hypothetical protein